MPTLTQKLLRSVLHYDADSGTFTWVKATGPRARVGERAGWFMNEYWMIKVFGKTYCAHRLAWLYMTGKFPRQEIDHKNGRPSDNKFANLREATRSQNMQNLRRARSDSASGILGVSWHRRIGKWQAQVVLNGRFVHCGYFTSKEDARAAYLSKKREIHKFCEI